jgi:hypothetical protein
MNYAGSTIFSGNSGANSSQFVENNAVVAVGAPYEVSGEQGDFIDARLSANENFGSFQFRYKVVGLEKSSFEVFYSEKPVWALYATLGAVALAILSIIVGFFVCCCSKCCKKKPNPQETA